MRIQKAPPGPASRCGIRRWRVPPEQVSDGRSAYDASATLKRKTYSDRSAEGDAEGPRVARQCALAVTRSTDSLEARTWSEERDTSGIRGALMGGGRR